MFVVEWPAYSFLSKKIEFSVALQGLYAEMTVLYKLPKPLVRATVVARPCKTNKSPYLLDARLDSTGEEVICHSAALGCCGYICAGVCVWVMERDGAGVSTHEVYHVERPGVGAGGSVVVCCHPTVANVIARRLYEYNYIIEDGVSALESEVVQGDSRFDFSGTLKDGQRFFLEVKCVVMADVIDDVASKVEAAKPKGAPDKLLAIFPYGKRKMSKEPLSPRALKHVEGLTEIARRDGVAAGTAHLLFIVMRPDVRAMTVTRLDPVYRAAVAAAIAAGVIVKAVCIEWIGGEAHYRGELAVEI